MARPDLSYLKNVLLALVGLINGVWCGATGIAFAPVLVPVLLWLLGTRTLRLGGTVLVITLCASLASLLAYYQARQLRLAEIACVAIATFAGSLLGSLPQLSFIRNSRSVKILFSIAVTAIGLWTMSLPGRHGLVATPAYTGQSLALLLCCAGFVAGLFAALAHMSGILIVPSLYAIAHRPILEAQATALAVLAVLSASPAASSIAQQRYSPQAAVWCSFGAVFGALYGSRFAVHQSGATLAFIYGISLIITALATAYAPSPSKNTAAPGPTPSRMSGSPPEDDSSASE